MKPSWGHHQHGGRESQQVSSQRCRATKPQEICHRFATDAGRFAEGQGEFHLEFIVCCTWIWKFWPPKTTAWNSWNIECWNFEVHEGCERTTNQGETWEWQEGARAMRFADVVWSTVDICVKCAGAIWNHFWDCDILAAFGTSLRLQRVSQSWRQGVSEMATGKCWNKNECPASWRPMPPTFSRRCFLPLHRVLEQATRFVNLMKTWWNSFAFRIFPIWRALGCVEMCGVWDVSSSKRKTWKTWKTRRLLNMAGVVQHAAKLWRRRATKKRDAGRRNQKTPHVVCGSFVETEHVRV